MSRTILEAALIGALALVTFQGCDDANGSIASPAAAGAEERLASVGPPSLSEFDEALGLTHEQAAALEPSLARWQERVAERRTRFEERRQKWAEGDDRGPRSGARTGRESGPAPEPPILPFLEESAKVLSHDQFLSLTTMLRERREALPERPGQGGGRGAGRPARGMGHPGPGRLERHALVREHALERLEQRLDRQAAFLTQVLKLDDDQASAVEKEFESALDEARAALSSAGDEPTPGKAMNRAHEIIEKTASSVRGHLNAEQAETFDALRTLLVPAPVRSSRPE